LGLFGGVSNSTGFGIFLLLDKGFHSVFVDICGVAKTTAYLLDLTTIVVGFYFVLHLIFYVLFFELFLLLQLVQQTVVIRTKAS